MLVESDVKAVLTYFPTKNVHVLDIHRTCVRSETHVTKYNNVTSIDKNAYLSIVYQFRIWLNTRFTKTYLGSVHESHFIGPSMHGIASSGMEILLNFKVEFINFHVI